jgi:type II secretory pathway pseudopilin PulG
MNPSAPLPNRRSKVGFTLVELMVSITITALLLTVLVGIIGVATDTWARNSAEIRANRQAKAFLETMAKDFESLVTRPGGRFVWLDMQMDTAANLPSVTTGQASASEAARLTFLTAATDRYLGEIGGPNDRGGDISCVSYALRYQDPIDGSNNPVTSTFVFKRLLVDPDETFRDLLGQEDLAAAIGPYAARLEDSSNFICENVHQFTVTYLVEIQRTVDGVSRPETVRVALSSEGVGGRFALTGLGIASDIDESGVSEEQLAAGRLRAVEISLSVLSDAGIARLSDGQGLSPGDYGRNVFHYSRVVTVPSL